MYLVHSDRLLTRYDCSTRGSSIYVFCTKYLSSLNIFALLEVVLFEHMFYLHKLFDIRKLFEYPLIYTKCSNIASYLKHRAACYQLAAAQYTDSVQIICPAWIFCTAWSCPIWTYVLFSPSIYTNYSSFTSATQYCNYAER